MTLPRTLTPHQHKLFSELMTRVRLGISGIEQLHVSLEHDFAALYDLTGDPVFQRAFDQLHSVPHSHPAPGVSAIGVAMTHDPSRLATVEQIMNGNNPFETVDTPLGKMERWRAEAMFIGTTGGIQSVYEAKYVKL